MWKSRDPSYLRDATRKPWGRQQGRKHPLTNSKKTFHSNTQSVTHVPTFAPANRRKQQSLSLFPVLLLWLSFEPSLAPVEPCSLWDEKCVHTHTSLSGCSLTSKSKRSPQLLLTKNCYLDKNTSKTRLYRLFVFDLFQKKTHWFKTCFHACKTNVSSLKCPNSHHLSFQHTKRW